MKLETLRSAEASWRSDMHEVAKKVLHEKKRVSQSERLVKEAEDRRLDFLSQLHAVLEGVAVGDQAAELTYEEAEMTLKGAKEREAHAKRMIFQAERMMDEAYQQAELGQKKRKQMMSAGAPPIISAEPDEFENFGKGATD